MPLPPALDKDPAALQQLDAGALEAQFKDLMAALDAARNANDAQRCLMLDLRTHQIELEIQSRELRATQQALQISRDHYERLFEEAPVGYLVLDRLGEIKSLNLTAANLLGEERSHLEGGQLVRFLRDSEIGAFLAYLRSVFERPECATMTCDLVLQLRDAAPVRVVRLRSLRREGLGAAECFAVMLDISAEYEAERKREASDRLRQAVLDALPSQIAVLDRDGRILAVNEAWQTLADENPGSQGLRDAIGTDYLAACRRIEDEVGGDFVGAADLIEEVIRRRRSGATMEYPCAGLARQRWFLMRAVPLHREVDGAVVAFQDVTDRRGAEEDARRARDALAQVARLNAVGILASSLIHELLQPLSAASFFCSAATQLAQGPSADPQRLIEVINRIDSQVHRAGDIMERLRVFLRGQEIRRIVVPLHKVFRRAFELVQWFATDHKVQVRMESPPVLPEILTDPVQIEQVLVNLICNSIHAIDAAGCERREVLVQVVKGADEIELVVRDTGPGLPPGRHEEVFDIFESTNDSRLGLGLAISRSIAESHGGRLWAEADPAEGAVFHFTLPVGEPLTATGDSFE